MSRNPLALTAVVVEHRPAVILAPVPAQRRQGRVEVLERVKAALAAAADIRTMCRVLQQELADGLDTTGFVVGLFDEVSQMIDVIYQTELGTEHPGGSFPLGNGFMSGVIRSRQPRLIRHWSAEGPRVQVQYATGTPGLPEATVTIPLISGTRVRGVLSLQSYAAGAYDEDDLLLVQSAGEALVAAFDALEHRGATALLAARRASEIEAVLNSMNEGLLILDQQGRIVSLNPPARAVFGPVGGGIILGQRLDRAEWGKWPLGARAVAEALAPMLDALRLGQAREVEVEVNTDGRRVLCFRSAPVQDANGCPSGGVVVFRDVTTQRDIARMKDELLSIASHDLRTPVTVMKAQAQLMQRLLRQGDVEPAALVERAQLMVEQSDRMTSMLNSLLDLSRVEAGRLELDLQPTDLVLLIGDAVATVRALTSRHTLLVEAPPTAEGMWDAARLERVLLNLLTNAVKYSPAGGSIGVKVELDAAHVQVSVTDDGLGIPESEIPLLFQRFFRASGTRSLEGTGLGLYISHGIIAAHGGRLWATSDGPGFGSTFSFTLPR